MSDWKSFFSNPYGFSHVHVTSLNTLLKQRGEKALLVNWSAKMRLRLSQASPVSKKNAFLKRWISHNSPGSFQSLKKSPGHAYLSVIDVVQVGSSLLARVKRSSAVQWLPEFGSVKTTVEDKPLALGQGSPCRLMLFEKTKSLHPPLILGHFRLKSERSATMVHLVALTLPPKKNSLPYLSPLQ